MPSMDYVKKKIIISMIAIVLLIITLFGITYAYFLSKVQGNKNDTSVGGSAGELALVYGDGNEYIEVRGVQPGTTIKSKTFTVENTGTREVENYDVILENVVNELLYYEDLTYELTCKSYNATDYETNGENATEVGSCNGNTSVFPKSDSIIVTNSIDVSIIHAYTLTLTYAETLEDQSLDMKKTISARVNIKHDGKKIKNLLVYGNSIQDGTPNPETPVEIQSLGDDTKNLFDTEAYVENAHHSTISLIENGILQKTVTYQENIDKMSYDLKENTSYTFSTDVNWLNYNNTNTTTGFRFYYSDGTYDRQYININATKFEYTTDSSKTLVAISSGGWQYNGEVEFTNIQLEEGSTKTNYEPYGYKIPLSIHGKNLVNVSDMNISFTDTYFKNHFPTSPTLLLLPNTTYTISFDYKINSASSDVSLGVGYGTSIYNVDIEYGYKYPNQDSGRLEYTFTTPSSFREGYTPYLQLRLARLDSKGNVDVDISNVQVEYGDTATSYTPYTTAHDKTYYVYASAPLRKIGDCTDNSCVDYIDYNNKQIVRNVKEYIFTGNETFISGNYPPTGAYQYFLTISDITTDVAYTKNTHFTNSYVVNGSNVGSYYNMYPSTEYGYSTLDLFTTWLNDKYNLGNPVILNYVSTSPQYEQVEMSNITLSPADTVISVCDSNNICASKIEVEYE